MKSPKTNSQIVLETLKKTLEQQFEHVNERFEQYKTQVLLLTKSVEQFRQK